MTRKLVFAASLMIIVVGMLGVASDLHVGYASPYTDVDVDTAYNMITNGSYPDLVVLDVRTQSEYDSGHIYGAVWIPHTELEARISELAGHKDHEIIVYCRSGVRSVNASETLDSFNFTKIYNMLGGILAWESSGYPTWNATVHNQNTTLNYDTIQAAIDAPQTLYGHTIFVEEGIYYEHVVLDKSLTLIGENRNTTIIDGNGTGTIIDAEYNITAIINLVANDVNINNFTVKNGGFLGLSLGAANCTINSIWSLDSTYCISLINSNKNYIVNSKFSNGTGGILLFNSTENRIIGNTVSEYLYAGIVTGGPKGSSKNLIANNTVSFNVYPGPGAPGYGMDIVGSHNKIFHNNISDNSEGIILDMADHNQIRSNFILNNTYFGIHMVMGSRNNTLIGNTIQESGSCGLFMEYGKNNFIYHNNFVDNKGQAYSGDLASYGNVWSHGLEGNYWSEYKGEDNDNDGIGDTPYTIYEYDQDNHPLMGKFYDFDATSEYHVQTICNSTIDDFQFNGTAILFDVSGENGTAGFCRICVPKALMNETYRVLVNGTEILPAPLPLPCSNNTHTYLYFTYNHSTQEVIIIPEFPSFLIIPLFMMTTLLAVIICKRRHRQRRKPVNQFQSLLWLSM